MKTKYVELGGKSFELCGTANTEGRAVSMRCNDFTDLFKHYARPSETKKSIWRNWCYWANKNNAHLVIDSHNCFRFTIRGYIETENGTYQLWITDCHDRAWKVEK